MSDHSAPKISVILPLYNQHQFLARGIRSVLGQTERDIELIIVDDASTDRSYDTASEFARRDSRVRLLHKERNTGPYDSRRAGVEMAAAQRICFIDGDDWYEPEALATLSTLMERNGADLVQVALRRRLTMLQFRYADNTDPSLLNRLIKGGEYRRLVGYIGLDSMVTPAVWNKIYRRDMLLEALAHPCHVRWGEDQIMNIHYTRLARNVYLSDYCGYNYRWHGSHESYKYSTLHDFKEVHRTKLLLGQDPVATRAELRRLWDYHVRQLLTDLGWTREGVVNVLRRELNDPVWREAGISLTAEESVRTQESNIKTNALKYLVKRLLQ